MTTSSTEERAISRWAYIWTFGGVVVLWLFGFEYARCRAPEVTAGSGMTDTPLERAAQYGDSFGAVNALFSGLAFAGVIVTILLQTQELGLQRNELKASVDAQKESATALREQGELLRNSNDATILAFIADRLQQEDVRAARKRIFGLFEQAKKQPQVESGRKTASAMINWTATDEVKNAAELIASTFDYAGILSVKSKWARDAVIVNWGHTMCRLWDIMLPFIDHARGELFHDPTRWNHFEAIVREARNVHGSQQSPEAKLA